MDVNQAEQIALNYLISVYPHLRFEDARLEEVELSDDEKYWSVTLSYTESIGSPLIRRSYKRFRIRASDGKVMAMTIRKP
jgi:hypothetical protein